MSTATRNKRVGWVQAMLIVLLILAVCFSMVKPVYATQETGIALISFYPNPDYKVLVGDEQAAMEKQELVNGKMVELVDPDGNMVAATGIYNESGTPYVEFANIPVGTYSVRLTQEALDLGYKQSTPTGYETTVDVTQGDSPVFAGSVGCWFSKDVTGYALINFYPNPDYKVLVGDEQAAMEKQELVNGKMVELVDADGNVVAATGIYNEAGTPYVEFANIPIGTYSVRLTQEALDLGYKQSTPAGYETTVDVTQGDSPVFAGSVGWWFAKDVSEEPGTVEPGTEDPGTVEEEPTDTENVQNTDAADDAKKNADTEQKAANDAPDTGDRSARGLWSILLLLAGGGLGTIYALNRKMSR